MFVNLYPFLCAPLVSSDVHASSRRDWIVCMCSMFKLIQACEKANSKGQLESIDALLGSGLLMYDRHAKIWVRRKRRELFRFIGSEIFNIL